MKLTTSRLRICVLGGTGFLGTELISHLAAAGHWVRVPTRRLTHGSHLRVLPTVEVIAANIHDRRVLGELLSGMDVAVNLVGILNETHRVSFESVHVQLTAKLLEEARIARVRRLLHVSALGADAHNAPSRYLRTKGRAEQLVKEADFLAPTLFRPSVIFGPGDTLTNRFQGLLRLAGGFIPLARATTRFAPIWVEDVAAALVNALHDRASSGRTYELCGPEIVTLEQLVRVTAASAGQACHVIRVPNFLARLQALVMGLLPGKPFSLDNFRSLSVDSVCREDGCAALGIRPRGMSAIVPTYLGGESLQARLNRYRATVAR